MSKNNDILSQEEIDALMNDKNSDNNLNDDEIDVLGEIGNIAMGSAATALYSLLGKKVEITAPEVAILNFSEVTEDYNRPCVLVTVEYIEGLEGVNLLIIKEEDAAIIADLMMGGDGSVDNFELDEIRLSAVGEAMNQMMGASSTAMSSIINNVVNISPPRVEYINLNDAVENSNSFFSSDDSVVVTSFDLKVGDLIDSNFKQLSLVDFTRDMVENLMKNESGLTAKGDNIQQDEVSAVSEEELNSSYKKESPKKESSQKQEQRSRGVSKRMQEVARTGNIEKEDLAVQTAQFPDFDMGSAEPLPQNMELIKDVPLQVTVRLGKARMTIREILDLGEGSIVELDKLAGEPVDLFVNGKLVAKGEVVVIDENFGFRVKDIISPMERINNI